MKFDLIRTHPGTFHADDVFAVACLLLINPKASVVREDVEISTTRLCKQDYVKGEVNDVIVDIGGRYYPVAGFFDHHQASFKEVHSIVPNPILEDNKVWPMAAFGLIWRHFGFKICSCDQEVYEWMERNLVCYNDALDNGIEIVGNQASLTDIVDDFNCLPEIDQDLRFTKAVAWAQAVIIARMAQARKYAAGYRTVKAILSENRSDTIEVPGGYYWFAPLLELNTQRTTPILWVIYYRQDKTWAVQAVSTLKAQFTPQYAFPESWRGLTGEVLKQVTALDTSIFCHKSGHLYVCKIKDDAIASIFKMKEYYDLP